MLMSFARTSWEIPTHFVDRSLALHAFYDLMELLLEHLEGALPVELAAPFADVEKSNQRLPLTHAFVMLLTVALCTVH